MSATAVPQAGLPPVGVRGPLTLAAVVSAASIGAAMIWSFAAPLQSAVVAPGVLVVDSSRKTVEHPEGGVVSQLLVREGDTVKAGQVLIRLDRTVAEATADMLRGDLMASQAAQARLSAERDQRSDVAFPGPLSQAAGDPKAAEAMAAERRIFLAHREQIAGETHILEQRNAESNAQIHGLQEQIAAEDRQHALISDEIKGIESLVNHGFAPKPRLLELQERLAQVEGEQARNLSAIEELHKQIGEGQMRILDLRAQTLSDGVQKLRDEQTHGLDLAERQRAADDTLRRTDITAPASGRVVGLKVFTVGGVVAPREPLMDIVPTADALVVDAQVPVNDAALLKVGQPVELRFPALNPRTTPTVPGSVANVSADRLVEPKTGAPYYLVRIRVGSTARLPQDTALKAGMPVEAMIRTGSRTFAQYLAKPITDFAGRAMREK